MDVSMLGGWHWVYKPTPPGVEDLTSVSAPRLPLGLSTDCPGTASPEPHTRQYDRFMSNRPTPVEPRWPVILALAAVVVLHFSLPDMLSLGPNWLLVAVFAVLAALVSISHSRGADGIASVGGLIMISSVTAAVIASLVLLIRFLPSHKESPVHLLQSAASLWISNVLVFAAWYWKLDAGGPNQRETARSHNQGAFLFPLSLIH